MSADMFHPAWAGWFSGRLEALLDAIDRGDDRLVARIAEQARYDLARFEADERPAHLPA